MPQTKPDHVLRAAKCGLFSYLLRKCYIYSCFRGGWKLVISNLHEVVISDIATSCLLLVTSFQLPVLNSSSDMLWLSHVCPYKRVSCNNPSLLASFPGLPCFNSLVCVQYNTRKRKSAKTGKAWSHWSRECCQVDARWMQE